MSKMLMGQINHARDRVKQLKAEKSGNSPRTPKFLDSTRFLEDLKKGAVTVTGPKLKEAFNAYISGIKLPCVESSSKYNFELRAHVTTYELTEKSASSVEDALAAREYLKINEAEALRYNRERELYELRQEALTVKAQQVEDAIVLGDQQAALIALQEFATFDVGF